MKNYTVYECIRKLEEKGCKIEGEEINVKEAYNKGKLGNGSWGMIDFLRKPCQQGGMGAYVRGVPIPERVLIFIPRRKSG